MVLKTTLLSIIVFIFSAGVSFAASLYMEPQSGIYAEGTSFSIKVRVDNQDECVNAASVSVLYPKERIKAVDVARGDSIFTLWAQEPLIDDENGVVSFAGGIPGGYCGRVAGDPGLTNVIAEIIFQVPGLTIGPKGPDSGTIEISSESSVLLNDGRGTEAELIVGNSAFSIVPPGEAVQDYDWFDVIREDDVRPEPFSIELVRDESIENSKWFIVFNTVDKQSGIDYFEVYETSIENEGFVVGLKDTPSRWKKVDQIPYILEDQSLNSVIRVRAIDNAGNERLAARIPDESLRTNIIKPFSKNAFYIVGGVIGLLLLITLVFLMYRKMNKKKELTHDTIESEVDIVDNISNEIDRKQQEGNDTQREI